jgi:hypothetical protein
LIVSRAAWMERWKVQACTRWEEFARWLRPRMATRADLFRYRLGMGFGSKPRTMQAGQNPRFFFSPRQVPALCTQLRRRMPNQAAEIVERAERICRHRIDLLGYDSVFCGTEIEWHRDAVHGRQIPRKPWFRLRNLGLGEADCRVIWELNRHQHLVTLAKAYRLTGNGKFATEVFCQWRHWRQQNPYPMGVNWVSSREVALRSLSWLWMFFLLADSPQLPPGFHAEWLRALSVHGRYLEYYGLEFALPGSLRLAQGVALFFIGTLCPELEAAERWKRLGWAIVIEEADRQAVHSSQPEADGVRFEQSTCEYVYTIDFLLHACALATLNGVAVPAEFETTLEKMLDVLCLLSRAGAPPHLGGDDGGRVFDANRNKPEHLLDPLSTGAVLFGRGEFKYLANELREETFWLLGEDGVAEFDRLHAKHPAHGPAALESEGLYLMASAEREQQLVIDARPQHIIQGADVHALALGISLNRGGRALLIDPGGLQFASTGPEHDWLRGTNVHNTLLVKSMSYGKTASGESAAGKAGAARADLSSVKAEGWMSGEGFDLFIGSHDGCSGLSPSVLHRRWVFSLNSEFWLVRDLALGEGAYGLGLFWHLCPELSRFGGTTGMFVESGGGTGLRVLAAEGHGWSQEIRQGWWSPVYGRREPLNLLHFSTVAELPAEFVTLLAPMAESPAYEGSLTRIRQSPVRGLVAGYRYQTAVEEHCMYFGQGKVWTLGPWTSDAEFLYWGGTPGGGRALICCKGTYVEASGKRIIASTRPLLRCEVIVSKGKLDLFSSNEPGVEVNHRVLDELAAEFAASPCRLIRPRKIAVGE